MYSFFTTYKDELIYTFIVLIILLITRAIIVVAVNKIGKKSGTTEARAALIGRYVTVTLVLLALLIEAFILGARTSDITLVFSSVFAVIGIALFAIWSILSNITSGVIMFFSFPYKVGDKIKIHDKDYPVEAIIEDIRAFQLILREDNGDLVTYPNNLILQKAVTLMKKDALDDSSIL
ncbi:mechanosensitive ion channel domain-containing protein [Winogradskyella sp. MH6]|jgi:small-conductance mechanosensitive channel|uniref:mechanosensitive ion channel domain-containing protein n=1 Tax=Winogradskyella sp. MH6 TaxID=2929510 RepID=UPI000C3BE11A|nr:mechanosensitive ion channel domain-containing protein [Winogradskyella sp. MH6]MAB49004.1 mechanosensitive ion channel protein MscS [Flavobacteriaceae bacterium]MBD09818.1 mechanosensitive ion channel protein MscS [Flavobacteriaceae bacterium]|tara:strand:- start:1485 stop:2018 length:534 start_codon:yes stop_codon:yes gene_type:complete